MKDCNPVSTPTQFGLKLNKDHGGKKVDSIIYKQIVGSLMYLTATRPDIMHSVSLISRYMENPIELHFLATKKICLTCKELRFWVVYKKGKRSDLIGLTNSDYAGDQDNRGALRVCFYAGIGAVSWSSKKQSIVTLSTTEAEFVAVTTCAFQAIWLRKFLKSFISSKWSYYNFL
ncbi:Retrovirus-related Pol polyprotein from transposon TNT 1-94 [Vitis vinifera]|uniref:Retrovirus-related Pol polyprotein from transposon TNT 1-94 n=1 Tax=Vitis vinifera TaxID=29760 RepID=A0A438E1A6_VITVI|nr:Retrovirus-related Pol polyprotein from transposon TNT 1-94 [Vitis vinifera]